jgi:hypothetical protein
VSSTASKKQAIIDKERDTHTHRQRKNAEGPFQKYELLYTGRETDKEKHKPTKRERVPG